MKNNYGGVLLLVKLQAEYGVYYEIQNYVGRNINT